MLQWTDKTKIPENDAHCEFILIFLLNFTNFSLFFSDFSIYGREANPDQQQSARQLWDQQQAQGRKRIFVRFEQAGPSKTE